MEATWYVEISWNIAQRSDISILNKISNLTVSHYDGTYYNTDFVHAKFPKEVIKQEAA